MPDLGRRHLTCGLGVAGMVAAWRTGGLVATAQAQPAEPLDVPVLQTASSLELVLIAAYQRALRSPGVTEGPASPFLRRLAESAVGHHRDHLERFTSKLRETGARTQDQPNPHYQEVLDKGSLGTAGAAVALLAQLEEAATETYLANLPLLDDVSFRPVMESVAGVEGQHLVVLRIAGALFEGGRDSALALPLGRGGTGDVPVGAGRAFPWPFAATEFASPPEEGAVDRPPPTTTTALEVPNP